MDQNVYNFQQYLEDSTPPLGYIRVMHAVPNAPNVDVYANDTLVFNDLAYGEYTDYLGLPEGRYKVDIYVAGTINEPLLTTNLTNNEGAYMTVAATGTLDDLRMVGVLDADMPMEPGRAMIRVVHLAPNTPAIDINVMNGDPIFDNISFREVTAYEDFAPNSYTFEIRGDEGDRLVLTIPNVDAQRDRYYTIYAIGLLAEQPELQALVVTDGAAMSGMPMNGTPMNGVPMYGQPMNETPMYGAPTNQVPINPNNR